MHYLYVDETYADDHYYTVGLMLDDHQYSYLYTALCELVENNQRLWEMDKMPEFHAHELMSRKSGGEWAVLGSSIAARIRIYQQVLEIIANTGGAVFVEGVVPSRLKSKYKYPQSPHEVTFTRVLERANEYATKAGVKFRVLADEVSEKNYLTGLVRKYKVSPTPGYKSQVFSALVSDVEFISSSESLGIQAVDMVAYIYRRAAHCETASRDARRAAKRLFSVVEPLIVWRRLWYP